MSTAIPDSAAYRISAVAKWVGTDQRAVRGAEAAPSCVGVFMKRRGYLKKSELKSGPIRVGERLQQMSAERTDLFPPGVLWCM